MQRLSNNCSDERFLVHTCTCNFYCNRQIWQQYQNMYPLFLSDKSSEVINKTKKFFNDQDTWMRMMIKEKSSSDAFWRHMSYIVAQFDGLYAGYKSVAKSEWVSYIMRRVYGFISHYYVHYCYMFCTFLLQNSNVFVVQLLNGVGDLIDLMKAVDPSTRPDFSEMSPDEVFSYVRSQGHCSAMVKVCGKWQCVLWRESIFNC